MTKLYGVSCHHSCCQFVCHRLCHLYCQLLRQLYTKILSVYNPLYIIWWIDENSSTITNTLCHSPVSVIINCYIRWYWWYVRRNNNNWLACWTKMMVDRRPPCWIFVHVLVHLLFQLYMYSWVMLLITLYDGFMLVQITWYTTRMTVWRTFVMMSCCYQ